MKGWLAPFTLWTPINTGDFKEKMKGEGYLRNWFFFKTDTDKMPTCGTIVPLWRAQKCPLNRIRRSHVAQLRSHVPRFRSHDFLFRFHKRQMRSEKATLLPGTKSFWAFSPYSNHLRKLSIIYWNWFAWRQSWHRFRLLSHQTPLVNVFRSWWLASASCGSKRLFM